MWRNWLRPWLKRAVGSQRETLESLGAPIEVRTDRWGVCHLLASDEEDLFRGQGYITARDRLFQMDMLRRTAGGRLAEIYGDVPGMGFDPTLHLRGQGLASIDYFMRVMGLEKAAQEGLSWISPRTHRALLSYAEGVNEYIAYARRRDRLPLAYKMLTSDVGEWSPTDSLLIVRLLGFQLSFSWRLLLAFGAVCAKMSDDPARLETMLPPHLNLSLGLEGLPSGLSQLFGSPEQEELVEQAQTDGMMFGGTGKGSCSWVVSGRWTRHGSPLLCNDPHLLLRLPTAFYQSRLVGGEYNVIGQAIPGCPGIFAGHNAEIAWGASLGRVDDSDIFLEELDRTGERYRHQERYLPLIRREEIIKVRGESPRQRWVRSTSRGPLLSDALRGPLPGDLTYSLSWVGQEGVREAEAMLQLNRASNWEQFLQATRYARVPALGYVYADRQGHIGGILAGRCPQRPGNKRIFRPLQAAQGDADWQGDIPFEELPRLLDPEEGFLILTGQQPSRSLPEHTIQGIWHPPYRYRRIKDMLKRQLEKKPDTTSMGRLQRDHYSLWGPHFIERILKPYAQRAQLAEPIKECLQSLLEWNGRVGPESLAACYFTTVQLKLMEQVYRPQMGEDLYRRWIDIATEFEQPIEPIFRDLGSWTEQSQDALLHTALTQAYHELQKRLGNDSKQWQWSRLHRLTLHPIFFRSGGLESNFTRGPYGTGGNASSINTGNHSWSRPFEHRVGASARQIIDLGQWDHSSWVLCGGQHEDPQSKHYDDQLALWLGGDDLPMYYTPSSLHLMQQDWLLPHGFRGQMPAYLSALASHQEALQAPRPSSTPNEATAETNKR